VLTHERDSAGHERHDGEHLRQLIEDPRRLALLPAAE
jgi:hypothetical protein